MMRRWLALILSLAVLALPFGATAPARADDGAAAGAACACDGPPACAERECPPDADCGTCVRVPVLAADATADADGTRAATRSRSQRPAWHGRSIAPAPEPPRA
jgi:hypothetical protein